MRTLETCTPPIMKRRIDVIAETEQVILALNKGF